MIKCNVEFILLFTELNRKVMSSNDMSPSPTFNRIKS